MLNELLCLTYLQTVWKDVGISKLTSQLWRAVLCVLLLYSPLSSHEPEAGHLNAPDQLCDGEMGKRK